MSRTDTAATAPEFLITKEYRRFEEFCNACRRERYIGLCYGPPGVGKTLSARHYARWPMIEGRDPFDCPSTVPRELAECRTLLYTPAVTNTPRSVRADIADGKLLLKGLAGKAGRTRADLSSIEYRDVCELIIVDEADRLNMPSLETLRDLYDREGFGLVSSACQDWKNAWRAILSSIPGSVLPTPSGP